MESQDGGAAFAATPAPMAGLGNFKGVMLCNRPSDEPGMKAMGGGDDVPPFKSAISTTHGEVLGLAPCKKPTQHAEVKTRGPSAALRRHVKWLKELQTQMKEEKAQVESEIQDQEQRKAKMKAAISKHRDAVRQMMQQRDAELLGQTGSAAQASSEAEATKKKAVSKAAKPLWAMTAKEKEDFEDAEADDLIDFAENLDYEKYLGDYEFRQGLNALKDCAGRVQKEQDAFKDAIMRDFNEKAAAEEEEEKSTSAGGSPRSKLEEGVDGVSIFGSDYSAGGGGLKSRAEERGNGDGRPEWDQSTSCGEERTVVDPSIKAAAERALEANPHLKQVHSKDSMQRIIEKAVRERQEHLPELHEHMRCDPPPPVPLIVSSEDTLTRLHKPVDCSQLPYLYRSPAV
mmetsp:Transcript_27832/g.64668  ORF Transcript_27832/g.64668 Transcript_27832/m.64668 type:complete len:400 (+) Transcript_27832:152-1351(+)